MSSIKAGKRAALIRVNRLDQTSKNGVFNAYALDREASKLLKEVPLMELWVSHDGRQAILRTGVLRLAGIASRLHVPSANPAKQVSAKTAALGHTCSVCGKPKAPGGTGVCATCYRAKSQKKFNDLVEFAEYWDVRHRNGMHETFKGPDGEVHVITEVHYDSDEEIYGAFAGTEDED